MDYSDKPLNLAEQEVVNHIRRWPTLIKSASDFFHDSVLSGSSYYWKNGLLVYNERPMKGKKYPFAISEEVARSYYNRNHERTLPTVQNPYRQTPIMCIPDDAHEDWLDFIRFHLYLDSLITPEFYKILIEADCINRYGKRKNPNAIHYSNYISEWNNYYPKIASYRAKIQVIQETRLTGQIPPETYQGMYI